MSGIHVTPRFSLPLLAVGQAQKEVTHNEAIALIDLLCHMTVEAGPIDAPPSSPVPGQAWIVGLAPTGAWAGQARSLAGWTDGGWRFIAPRQGMRVLRAADGVWLRCDGSDWIEPASVAVPAGGGVIDTEARAAIAALIDQLSAHGLLKAV